MPCGVDLFVNDNLVVSGRLGLLNRPRPISLVPSLCIDQKVCAVSYELAQHPSSTIALYPCSTSMQLEIALNTFPPAPWPLVPPLLFPLASLASFRYKLFMIYVCLEITRSFDWSR